MSFQKWVWISWQFVGFHQWKDALDEVDFLKYKHRHLFKVKVWIEIAEDDREIEFFMFQRFMKEQYQDEIDFGNQSCEMISHDMNQYIISEYPDRNVKISISEDGENGTYIEYQNKE